MIAKIKREYFKKYRIRKISPNSGWMDEVRRSIINKDFTEKDAEDRELCRRKMSLG